MATLKEVARKAGVSLGTASNVLTGARVVTAELKRRVERALRDLDYRPNHVARSLKMRQTRMLGMVISDITNPFFPELVRGAEDAAMARGYLLTTFNTDDRVDREKQVFDILQTRRVDGLLVVVALPRGGHQHVHDAHRNGIPIVCLDRIQEEVPVDSVTVDNEEGVKSAILHLAAQGHREIGYLGGQRSLHISEERRRGFLSGLKAAGLRMNRDWVKEGDFRPESGYRLAKELFGQSRQPTALFVGNILMTVGVLRAMTELGLETPRDLALATFDHIALMDAFRPQLTAVVQPSYEIGRQGANLLIDRIEGRTKGTEPVHVRLGTELRIGESTRGVKAAAAGADSFLFSDLKHR